jgi:hypothetical protein
MAARVWGSEPSVTQSYFCYRRAASNIDMASSTNKSSSQSTTSGPSSSPPIDIKPRKPKPNSSLPTLVNSREKDPKTPIQSPDSYAFAGRLPPTLGDALPQNVQGESNLTLQSQRTQRIIERLIEHNNTESILDGLDKDVLMELRASSDYAFALPFRIDNESFRTWDRRLSESGGYEYDTRREELIIKTLPGPLHEGVVEVFSDWFTRLKDSRAFKRHGKLKHRSNQGLSS